MKGFFNFVSLFLHFYILSAAWAFGSTHQCTSELRLAIFSLQVARCQKIEAQFSPHELRWMLGRNIGKGLAVLGREGFPYNSIYSYRAYNKQQNKSDMLMNGFCARFLSLLYRETSLSTPTKQNPLPLLPNCPQLLSQLRRSEYHDIKPDAPVTTSPQANLVLWSIPCITMLSSPLFVSFLLWSSAWAASTCPKDPGDNQWTSVDCEKVQLPYGKNSIVPSEFLSSPPPAPLQG